MKVVGIVKYIKERQLKNICRRCELHIKFKPNGLLGSALDLHIFAINTLRMFLKYYALVVTQVVTYILGRNIKHS